MFLQAYLGSRNESLTWDEPSYISAGYSYLTTGEFALNPSHPPLTQELIAFPLLFLDLNAPPGKLADWLSAPNPVVAYGKALIFEAGNDPLRIAFWARLTPQILGCALVLVAFFWASQIIGRWTALIACVLIAFCPNLIAHSKLATEDVACTCFMFLAAWSFWNMWQKKSMASAVLCGVITGLALLSKFTAILLFPMYALITLIVMLHEGKGITRQSWTHLSVVIGSAVLVAIAGYGFHPSLYVQGVSKIYTDLRPGYIHYLYGHVSASAWWYYSMAAFIVKVPVPVIALIAAGIFLIAVTTLRQSKHLPFFVVPPLLIIGASFLDKENFGLRRILPAFPFLFMTVAYAAQYVQQKRMLKVALAALLCWGVIDCIAIFPHHLSYFNEATGGPSNGAAFLDDSNIDWGQDLPSLAQWQQQHPEARPLRLAYFGIADPAAYGVEAETFEPSDVNAPQKGVYYAVSVHNLVSFRKLSLTSGHGVDWLSKYTPIGKAGYSIYIYKM